MLLAFLFSLSASRLGNCTKKNSFIDITDANASSVIGKSTPVFVRFIQKYCAYSTATENYWQEASKLYPNIKFATAECIFGAPKLCDENQYYQKIFPHFSLIPAGTRSPTSSFLNSNSLAVSSNQYVNTITSHLKLYPFDSSVIESLIPETTNKFYRAHKYPIFILYDSNCDEDNAFISQWLTGLINNEIVSSEYGFGKLDCSLYPDECNKWGGEYPAVHVYSRSKGLSVRIDTYSEFREKIDSVLNFLDQNNKAAPTPVPYAAQNQPASDYSGYTVYKAEALENRDMDTIHNKYRAANTKSYGDSETNNTPQAKNCHDADLKPEVITDVLKLLNFYRELAGVPNDVTNNASLNTGCMLGAKVASHNNKIDHYPPDGWFSQCGFSANKQLVKTVMAQSNLAQADFEYPVLSMINGLIDDPGTTNEGEVGHRRWFLYPYLKTIGVGYYPFSRSPITIGGQQYYTENKASGVFQVSHNPVVLDDYTGVNFVAWPAPGPFPLERIPESWSVTFKTLKDMSITVNDIDIKITRDDGQTLDCSRVDLQHENGNCRSGCLIFKPAFSSYKLVTAGHEYHVQIIITKGTIKEILDYTVKPFDDKEQQEVCFYDKDITKCPINIDEANKFGPQQYQSYKPTGIKRALIHVVEDITLSETLSLDFASHIIVKGNHKINGQIIVGTATQLDFGETSQSDIVINADLSSSLVTGLLESPISPKSVKIQIVNSIKAPSGYTRYKSMIYCGKYTHIDYPKEVFGGDYVYYISIAYNGIEASLATTTVLSTEYFCQGGNKYSLKSCTPFTNFYETRLLKTSMKQIKVYCQSQINMTVSSFNYNSNAKYIVYNSAHTALEYGPTLEKKVKSISIAPMSPKNSLNFEAHLSPYYSPMYFNQEVFDKRYPFKNLELTRLLNNNNNYQIPDLLGDNSSIEMVKYIETEVYDETDAPFADENGNYQYDKEAATSPIFVTNRLYKSYQFTTTKENVIVRIEPSFNTISAPITLVFPEKEANYKAIYVMNYRSATIKSEKTLFSKIRLVNVSQVRFVDLNNQEITGVMTDVIGSEKIDMVSNVKYTDLAFRTDSLVNLTGSSCENVHIFDCNPVIHNLELVNLEVVNGYPTFINCNIKGSISIKMTNEQSSAIQIHNNPNFNPTDVTIKLQVSSSSRILEDNQELMPIFAGLDSNIIDQLKSKTKFVDYEGNSLTAYKTVSTKDNKGLYAAQSSFDENNAPQTPDADSFYVDYNSNPSYELNQPPEGTEFTDSIQDPLWDDYPQFEEPVDPEQPVDSSNSSGSGPYDPNDSSGAGPYDPNDSTNNGKGNGGKVAGIVIGVILAVACVAVAGFFGFRYLKSHKENDDQEIQQETRMDEDKPNIDNYEI